MSKDANGLFETDPETYKQWKARHTLLKVLNKLGVKCDFTKDHFNQHFFLQYINETLNDIATTSKNILKKLQKVKSE